MKRIIALIIALLLSGHALLFYALSAVIYVLVLIALAVFFIKIKWQDALAFSVSLALVTLVIAFAADKLVTTETVYYRPHEIFGHPDGRYGKNVRFEMAMPHGDLKAMALYTEVEQEPRHVVFKTDSSGFRNSMAYHGQEYLLVGDSFIVGNGSTQQDILAEQLLNRHGIDAYNLSYPGGVKDYYYLIESFKKSTGTDARVILFLFEGNDFDVKENPTSAIPPRDSDRGNPATTALSNYHKLFSETQMYRFLYSASRRIIKVHIKRKEEEVEVWNIGGLPVAFLKSYIKKSERDFLPENTETELLLSALKDDIAHIYFIPTKYRVYHAHINGREQNKNQALPDMQWQYTREIGRKLGVPTTNLTPALVEESERLLEQGVLTFWRDDTHWNKHGIAVAADVISRQLSQDE